MLTIAGKKRRLVYIEWEDAYGCSPDWEVIKDSPNATPLLCASVGWVVQEDKKLTVIVPHLSRINRNDPTRHGCGDMAIPTANIVRMVTLKIPK